MRSLESAVVVVMIKVEILAKILVKTMGFEMKMYGSDC